VKYFDWDEKKNQKLKEEREISFEEILVAVENERLLNVVEHPNKKRYGKQKVMIVEINEYVYLVPFVEDEEKVFLKTIIPSRKATEKYLLKGGK
jgi:uncharacterized DUF497 family protein